MKCPYCGGKGKWRMHRPTWMKFTPGKMENMRCPDCGHEYTRWLTLFSIKNRKAQKIIGAWHFIVFFVSVILLGFIIALFLGS